MLDDAWGCAYGYRFAYNNAYGYVTPTPCLTNACVYASSNACGYAYGNAFGTMPVGVPVVMRCLSMAVVMPVACLR